MEPGALSCADNAVEQNSTYTYCVTATDADENTSPLLTPGAPNCKACIPSAPPPDPPANVSPTLAANRTDVNIYWTKSTSDNGIDGGYAVFRCADAACATKTSVKTCSQLAASSPAVKNISAAAPVTLVSEPAGEWSYGVAFQTSCEAGAQSSSLATGGPVAVPQPPSCADPARCAVISSCLNFAEKISCSPLLEIDTAHKDENGFVKLPRQGVKIGVMAPDGSDIGPQATTGEDGNYELKIDTDKVSINAAGKYHVVMIIPESQRAGAPCTANISQAECRMLLKETLLAPNSPVIKPSLPPLPAPGGGRAEIANGNCDNMINMKDFGVMRMSFNKSAGQPGYQTYADFNGDGSVNMADFNVLKMYFNKELGAGPAFDSTLCAPQE